MARKKLVVDTDAGIDDAGALVMALAAHKAGTGFPVIIHGHGGGRGGVTPLWKAKVRVPPPCRTLSSFFGPFFMNFLALSPPSPLLKPKVLPPPGAKI